MTDRMRTIAETFARQAGMVKILEQHAHEYGAGTFEDTEYPELEKFAELIVRECAGIVDDKIEVSRYVHEAELLRECSTTIKLHFGVAE